MDEEELFACSGGNKSATPVGAGGLVHGQVNKRRDPGLQVILVFLPLHALSA